jgi:succinate dehydrogenase/fumarate reductase cytochrome b subunit
VTKLSKLGKSSGFFFVQQFRMEALRDLWTGAGLNAIEGWHYELILAAFIRHLVDRGLNGVRLIISDACRGLTESAADYLPQVRWQRCMVHFYRNCL